jgi:hypothetical protein
MKEVKPMAKKTQKTLPPEENASETPVKSGKIVPTDSWINVKGKAIYVNIPEKDIRVVNGRVSFITSLVSIQDLASGEKLGVKLGRFQD